MALKGKVAVITGGARGIGRAIAERLAREGCDLMLADVDEDLVKQSAGEVAKQYGVRAEGRKTDVTKAEECERLMEETAKALGRLDILVNNAGITKDTLLVRMSDADWDAVLKVNLYGVFYCSRAAAKIMMKQRSGRIVNISSVVGLMGNPAQANYASTKAGVIGLTKTCARELASRNILVNAVAPGFIRTRLTDVLPEEVKKKYMEAIPLGRFGEAEDVANVVAFLCSDDSSYITGQVLSVNGGMYS